MGAAFPMPYIIGGVLGLAFAFKILWATLRSHLVAKHSCVGDLADLGKPRPDSEKIRGTAVVAGGRCAIVSSRQLCSDATIDNLVMLAWLRLVCYTTTTSAS